MIIINGKPELSLKKLKMAYKYGLERVY